MEDARSTPSSAGLAASSPTHAAPEARPQYSPPSRARRAALGALLSALQDRTGGAFASTPPVPSPEPERSDLDCAPVLAISPPVRPIQAADIDLPTCMRTTASRREPPRPWSRSSHC